MYLGLFQLLQFRLISLNVDELQYQKSPMDKVALLQKKNLLILDNYLTQV